MIWLLCKIRGRASIPAMSLTPLPLCSMSFACAIAAALTTVGSGVLTTDTQSYPHKTLHRRVDNGALVSCVGILSNQSLSGYDEEGRETETEDREMRDREEVAGSKRVGLRRVEGREPEDAQAGAVFPCQQTRDSR